LPCDTSFSLHSPYDTNVRKLIKRVAFESFYNFTAIKQMLLNTFFSNPAFLRRPTFKTEKSQKHLTAGLL
jgi:hypothetical protein